MEGRKEKVKIKYCEPSDVNFPLVVIIRRSYTWRRVSELSVQVVPEYLSRSEIQVQKVNKKNKERIKSLEDIEQIV